MMFNISNSDVLETLVGDVEWILSQQNSHEHFRLAFRVNGKLRGLVIYWQAPTRYGAFSVEKMDREDVLAMVAFLDAARLTEAERQEWNTHCEAEAGGSGRPPAAPTYR